MPTSQVHSTYNYLDTRMAELTENHYPLVEGIQLEPVTDIGNLSTMVHYCQSVGDYLMAQTLQEQLLRNFNQQVDSGNAH